MSTIGENARDGMRSSLKISAYDVLIAILIVREVRVSIRARHIDWVLLIIIMIEHVVGMTVPIWFLLFFNIVVIIFIDIVVFMIILLAHMAAIIELVCPSSLLVATEGGGSLCGGQVTSHSDAWTISSRLVGQRLSWHHSARRHSWSLSLIHISEPTRPY